MKAHRRTANEIQELKKLTIEVGKRNERYKAREDFSRTREAFCNTNNAIFDPRALAIFEQASKLVGIDQSKAEIIQLLTEEDGRVSAKQQLKLVSIVGCGGLGKTTLANQVYQVLKEEFECKAFVSVSRNPDLKNILRTILSEISGQAYASTKAGSIQQLIGNITNVLAHKRYFVVVDDIWDVDTWDVIKCAFPITCSGSIIITTTHINDVADLCRSSCTGCIYNMRPLDVVHSRQLFHRRLFDSNEDCPSNLQKVLDEILKKCGGLPLVIIAISGLLAITERTEHMWNQVKDSIGRALERNPSVEAMIKILSLSYFDLPPHLKTCLLHLSIFLEDSVIEKRALIWRWIAEGFIHKDGRYTTYVLGERCFNELLNRSLIQVAWTNEYGKVESCRVHDIILDFIISKSIEENFVTLIGVPYITSGTQRKVRRLSLQVDEEENPIRKTRMVLSHVRSLNVFGYSLEIPPLREFGHLRVLDLELCNQVENHHLANIGRLFQWRHLNLRWTEVSELPKEIGHLRCLEMLDIRGTQVQELPSTIVNLGRLVDLLHESSVKFPDGIEKMQALEMLGEVNVCRQPFNFLEELRQLQNLRKLVLNGSVDRVKKEEEEKIDFTVCGGCFLLERSLCPVPLSLQEFIMRGSHLKQVPDWVCSLVNLQLLRLEVEKFIESNLYILGNTLPTLLILELTGMRQHRYPRFTVSHKFGFRCLRKLYLEVCKWIVFEAGSMPKLEKLEIGVCFSNSSDFNTTSGSGDAFDLGMGNLPSLTSLKFATSAWVDSSLAAAQAAMERAAGRHPNRPTLIFQTIRL
ncbi:disease resistance protein PIK6-NP-like [Triticum dicoccoides]|uniref:disease resistance protein PIK6-NP-like n=1 Tax=Triticum dicoccoides TaxID=85692 RepID=UPI001891A415|nr:disease resistance protein PIK6-NP-like [Triticum dicoccoides]